MPSPRPRFSLALSLGVAALALSACSGDRAATGSPFEPVKPGVLTVATAFLPAPGFWEGTPPTDGFEAGLADALAGRLGLDRVDVVQVSFTDIVEGRLGGVDLALSQITPTRERDEVVDFSTPYLTAPPGVLALNRVHADDVRDLQGLDWVVSQVSTLTPIVMDRVRPHDTPLVVQDRADALAALRAGRAEALMLDLPVALGLAKAEPTLFHVIGQLDGDEGLAAVLPDGSHNVEVVDSAIHSLEADGTIDDLASTWLGESADDVPLILTEE